MNKLSFKIFELTTHASVCPEPYSDCEGCHCLRCTSSTGHFFIPVIRALLFLDFGFLHGLQICNRISIHLDCDLVKFTMQQYTILDFASSQTSLTVTFSTDPEVAAPVLDSVLPFLGLVNTQCEINEAIIPMKTGPHAAFCPSLESVLEKWTPWDDPLTSTHRYHMLITDVQLYGLMQDHSARRQHSIQLNTPSTVDRLVTVQLDLHLLSHVETAEFCARLYREMRSQKVEIQILQHELRDLRNRFGMALEQLAAHHEGLAPMLGLVHPLPEPAPDAEPDPWAGW